MQKLTILSLTDRLNSLLFSYHDIKKTRIQFKYMNQVAFDTTAETKMVS